MLTEAQRHQLYNELTEVLSTEGAAILMDVVGSVTITELATKTDIAELRSEVRSETASLRADIAELKQDLTRTFATLLFVSQGVLVSIVGLLVALT